MSSTIVQSSETMPGVFGLDFEVPVFFQFVPGKVVEVITHTHNRRAYGKQSNINTIIARPHIYGTTVPPSSDRLGEEYRYKPLLRGMVDVPTKGDPVLLCSWGADRYYLGPLNTENNVSFNNDSFHRDEIDHQGVRRSNLPENIDTISDLGKSKNFREMNAFRRMNKNVNPGLDFDLPEDRETSYQDVVPNEIHGDMIFEGRHGNSIRLGSRYLNPYIMLSNGRAPLQEEESLGDGSLISITNFGSIEDHFGTMNSRASFILGSDLDKNYFRKTIDLFAATNNLKNASKSLYEYSSNQIFLNSDRVIINTKENDLFVSSAFDLYLGAARNLNISTNQDFIINCRNSYLGNPYTLKGNDYEIKADKIEPMVLGKQLEIILNEMLDVLTKVVTATSAGPQPLMNGSIPLSQDELLLKPIRNKMKTMFSNYHFIEPNGEKPEEKEQE